MLGGPRPVGVGGDAQDVHAARLDLQHEQHVEPPQRHGVDVEEVDREHPGGLGAQELPPAQVVAAGRRRRYPGPLEDPADGRRADPVAQFEQLALHAPVAPGRVVPGEPFDQGRDLVRQRWPAGAVRVGPAPRDQAAMPTQHRARRDQPVAAHRPRQPPDQRGQDRPVGPVQPRPWLGSPQHRHLVAQHQQLGVLRRAGAGQQHQPTDQPDEDQVQQPQRHGRRSSRTAVAAPSRRSSACPSSGTRQGRCDVRQSTSLRHPCVASKGRGQISLPNAPQRSSGRESVSRSCRAPSCSLQVTRHRRRAVGQRGLWRLSRRVCQCDVLSR